SMDYGYTGMFVGLTKRTLNSKFGFFSFLLIAKSKRETYWSHRLWSVVDSRVTDDACVVIWKTMEVL
ncbi:hypothetical protein BaRGS_00039027, partial [Batillaria attramentaria]